MNFTKAIALPVVSGVLLVAGAGAVLAATAPAAPSGQHVLAATATATPTTPSASARPMAPMLTAVLDDLVGQGTITSAQEQAIVDAWVSKRGELKAERARIKSIFADGILTADELAQLPADSPLQQLKPLLTNGQITVDQIRKVGRDVLRELKAGGMGGIGGSRGMTGRGGTSAPASSPAPSVGG